MATKFITVSIDIMHDKNLSANQKFILAEVEQLSELERGCIASNQHFSDLIGVAKETVSRAISDLENKGYINTEIVAGTRNHVRHIRIDETSRPPRQNVKTPMTKRQETKENKLINKTINLEDFPKLNVNAFKDWINYKPKNYSKQGQVLSANKLSEYPHEVQQEMVNKSIMNNYQGLVEPKPKPSSTAKSEGFESFMDMKEHLSANFEQYKSIPFDFEGHTWKIGKNGIPYSADKVDDMPFDQRKRFWIHLMNNMNLLKVSA